MDKITYMDVKKRCKIVGVVGARITMFDAIKLQLRTFDMCHTYGRASSGCGSLMQIATNFLEKKVV